jgi:hypothetical protein
METRHEISQTRALEFMTAGKAIMTIQSKVTNKHFTFKFITPKEETGRQKPTWVRLLTGSDSYTYLGTIWGNDYKHGKKSSVTDQALGVLSFKWWFKSLVLNDRSRLDKISLFHEGHCMKCGRSLTTPESIENGIGPVCAGIMAKNSKYTLA